MDSLIKSKSIQEYCRVCFKSTELVSELTKLVNEKFSLSIKEMLNLLSPGLQVRSVFIRIILITQNKLKKNKSFGIVAN